MLTLDAHFFVFDVRVTAIITQTAYVGLRWVRRLQGGLMQSFSQTRQANGANGSFKGIFGAIPSFLAV